MISPTGEVCVSTDSTARMPSAPKGTQQELISACLGPLQVSHHFVWDCFGLAGGSAVVRGGGLGGTAGLVLLAQTPPALPCAAESSRREGVQRAHSHLSSAVLNHKQGRAAPYSFKEPFPLVLCQVCIQGAFLFRLSGTHFNVLLQKSLQNININALINRNHNTMQIQLV